MRDKQAVVEILLDRDPGIDDAMAIFYGLLAPEVTLTGTYTRGMTVADLRPWARHEHANGRVVLETDS